MADNGIVPSGNLANFDSFDPNGFFDGIIDAKTAKQAVGRIKVLEDMLKAADQFGEYASKFCLLEAQMYVEIAEIVGAEEQLTDSKRRLVEWIRDKTEDEIVEIIDECGKGTRIIQIKHREDRERSSNIKSNAINKEYKRISDEIVRRLNETGHTQLSKSVFIDEWRSVGNPDASTIRAYVKSTQDKILARNGRGLGDQQGTYMLVEKCERSQVAQIVQTRLESIVADLKTIKQICNETHFVVPKDGVQIISDLVNSLASTETMLDISVR